MLRKENEALKTELRKLQATTKKTSKNFNWPSFFKWLSITLAGVIFVAASIVFYAGMTLTNTDRFMQVAEPLAEQPAVQEALATKTTNALFERVDIESLSKEALPDRIDFLAPAVSEQIKQFTNDELQKLIASTSFQEAWNTRLEIAHARFIDRLANYEGDGTFNVNDIFGALTNRIDNEKLSFLQDKSLPPRIGDITVIEAEWLPQAHLVVANFHTVRAITIAVFIVLLVFAVWVSKNRRKTVMELASMIVILSVAMLLGLRIARLYVLNGADPQYLQAATEIWDVLTFPFIVQLVSTIVVALAVLLIGWLGGQSKSSTAVKQRVESLFAGRLHESVFSSENTVTKWVGKHQKTLLYVVAVGFVLSLFVIDLTQANFVWAVMISLLAVLSILTLSSKQH